MKIQIVSILSILLICSCNAVDSEKNTEHTVAKENNVVVKDTVNNFDKEQIVNYIGECEARMMKDAGKRPVDLMAAQSLISQYGSFIQQFPNDSAVPSYLFKQGELCIVVKNGKKAAACFSKIVNDFPNSLKLPYALYMCGFVNDDLLNDDATARTYYELLIKKFPRHELCASAKGAMQNLGKSDEQLIREFEKKNRR